MAVKSKSNPGSGYSRTAAYDQWDPPDAFASDAPADAGRTFTIAAYVWLSHSTPVYQNTSLETSRPVEDTSGLTLSYVLPYDKEVTERYGLYNGTTKIDWARYLVEETSAAVGNIFTWGASSTPARRSPPPTQTPAAGPARRANRRMRKPAGGTRTRTCRRARVPSPRAPWRCVGGLSM